MGSPSPAPVLRHATLAVVTYEERLRVPALWWALAALGVLALWVAYDAALGGIVAVLAAALLALGCAAWLVGQGAASVSVDGTGFRAGRAQLPPSAIGTIEALADDATALARGRDADPHAYYLLKGYVGSSVRVWVHDPHDPVPYWVVSTRDPRRLATALAAVRDTAASAA